MSDVTDFRVYQTAVKHAQRANVPRSAAVHAVAVARKQGASGHHVVGQLFHAATRNSNDPTPPRAA